MCLYVGQGPPSTRVDGAISQPLQHGITFVTVFCILATARHACHFFVSCAAAAVATTPLGHSLDRVSSFDSPSPVPSVTPWIRVSCARLLVSPLSCTCIAAPSPLSSLSLCSPPLAHTPLSHTLARHGRALRMRATLRLSPHSVTRLCTRAAPPVSHHAHRRYCWLLRRR